MFEVLLDDEEDEDAEDAEDDDEDEDAPTVGVAFLFGVEELSRGGDEPDACSCKWW